MSQQANIVDPEWENFFSAKAPTKAEPLERILGRVPIFSLLRAKELQQLARLVHVREFDRGEPVVRRGVEQSGLYLIRSGSVNLVREGQDGSQEVVANLGPPEMLGEFALLDETPRSTTVVAAERSELIGFFKPDLMDIVATSPEMGCMILLRLAEEMTATLNKDYRRLRETGWPQIDRPEGEGIDPTA